MKHTYYLSGPMSGIPDFNFPAFKAAAERLRNVHGYDILSAHEIDHGVDAGSLSWEQYLQNDLMMMLRGCDAIIVLPGWVGSKGASLELHVAREIKWPTYTYDPESSTGLRPLIFDYNLTRR